MITICIIAENEEGDIISRITLCLRNEDKHLKQKFIKDFIIYLLDIFDNIANIKIECN